ncbi:MAG: chemotaxis response regulator protein-glutamate methylesterase [Firmicutes bacterium]|nr:chemotaxis response regulator protein-glutamate methylesterase [Bacillota bacterium]
MPITVLIVDDSAFMRQVIKQMLTADPDIEVVGVAVNGLDALKKVQIYNPQVITLDLEMPQMDGLQFLAELMKANPLPVVVVSSLAVKGGEQTFNALQLGAVDFVTKPDSKPSQEIWTIQEELILKVKAAASVRPEQIKRLPSSASVEISPFRFEIKNGVVAVGASTGGPRALSFLLANLPKDFPWGILIAQHLPKEFIHSFALRLDSISPLTVKVAEDGEEVLPGKVLIAPSGLQTGVIREGGKQLIRLAESTALYRPSVDYLFNSVAETFGAQSIGVLLTGMGTDGAYGLKMMRRAGSTTIAESPETCVIYGMPRAAVEIGAATLQLPLTSIPQRLSSLLQEHRG